MTQIRIAAARLRPLSAVTSRRYEGRIRPEATTANRMTEKNGASTMRTTIPQIARAERSPIQAAR